MRPAGVRSVADGLPDFPWDTLAAAKMRAAAHPGGIVDLSVGTPVDSTPEVVRAAMAAAVDSPGYPTTLGTLELREAIAQFFVSARGVQGLGVEHCFPTIGSKELVSSLPGALGLGRGHAVAFPDIAYPTYDIGARLAATEPVPVDLRGLARSGDGAFAAEADADIARIKLLWVNSPSNPTGDVLTHAELAAVVTWARRRGVVVASDECYALLRWEEGDVPSILDPRVCGGSFDGLLAVYSLSKQSNLAGYRAGFVAGDPELIGDLVAVRKHAGLIVPRPVQEAMVAALSDVGEWGGQGVSARGHVAVQRERYSLRRERLRSAIVAAGGRIDHSEAGLYLWTTWNEPARVTIDRLAGLGILAAPGDFYGPAGDRHVRIALTATDERVAAAADRLLHVGANFTLR